MYRKISVSSGSPNPFVFLCLHLIIAFFTFRIMLSLKQAMWKPMSKHATLTEQTVLPRFDRTNTKEVVYIFNDLFSWFHEASRKLKRSNCATNFIIFFWIVTSSCLYIAVGFQDDSGKNKKTWHCIWGITPFRRNKLFFLFCSENKWKTWSIYASLN